MPLIGPVALAQALLLAFYAIVANLLGARWKYSALLASARHAIWASCIMVTVAVGILWVSLLRSDFSLEYVASYSSFELPWLFKLTALWGGQQGSLLLWTWLLSAFTAIVAFQNRRRNLKIAPYALAVLAAVAMFFLGMLNFVTRPFDLVKAIPTDGQDLNPLLQNYWMAIHPPSLYIGYVSAAVPFAFGTAALITGHLDDTWIRSTRRWAIFSWLFLTLGNLFGARWAYEVLGWGGYWAWDPVENAAFMPWLVMTAYLHSVMIQERKDMLKVWNLALIGLAFGLTLFGTFITRSGIISSVHSFTNSGLGPYFLTFLTIATVAYTALLLLRVKELRTPAEFESYLSREATFLFNNLVLIGITFAVFWGTIFPVISEAVRGVKITVGPSFFNKVNAPLALILMFLMGVGPLIAWRRSTPRNFAQTFASSAFVGAVTGIATAVAGVTGWYALTSFSLAAFVLTTIIVEFKRGVGARGRLMGERVPKATANLIAKNNRRYGGYVIHLGVILAFVGIVASSLFRQEVQRTVKEGQTIDVGPYHLVFRGTTITEDSHVQNQVADVELISNRRVIALLQPAKVFYRHQGQFATVVALRSTPLRDLYVVLAGVDDDGSATFQVFMTPLVLWLWVGGLIMALGTVIVMWPNVRERAVLTSLVNEIGIHNADLSIAAD
ncbi:MAG TPA: heme lyase CcmF/NrfE family subunit [Candidatus Binataceae bacterium]|nr:heme lyase CcmF/NrfE family subunit [Candidatus Binataceae bacterium]